MPFGIRITERGGDWMEGFDPLGGWRHSRFREEQQASGIGGCLTVKCQDFTVFCVLFCYLFFIFKYSTSNCSKIRLISLLIFFSGD